MMQLIHGKLKTMAGREIADGYLTIQGDKIVAVGEMKTLTEPQPDAVDLGGLTVCPGFIDPHTHLGMWEDGLDFEGDDGNEDTDPVTPHLRALDAVNPLDRCFDEALTYGITTVATGPGSANPIAGSWLCMKTYGRRVEQMAVCREIGMKFSLGENPKSTYNGKNQMPVTRMATAALIREQLKKALRYREDVIKAQNDPECDPPEYDMRCEALLPVLRREQKAFFHAHRADDIFTALRIAEEFSLDAVLIHATEGDLIADELREAGVPVIVGPILCDRSKPELRRLSTKTAGILVKSGVPIALCTDHPVIPIQYLPLSAGIAVAAGLPEENALYAMTLGAARILGVADRVGSLEVGKDADLLIYRDDPLKTIGVKPVCVIAGGRQVKGELPCGR